ncbi:QRFP-like peptide receptor [Anneissia japonica]|uniref:QRFP-like peptide receptor n=1 Tax=Anneissia japonica TaxID=1529436 RepID=UPI0014255968|nr:QRFP-like peptide receptor [Anneissia japonica]
MSDAEQLKEFLREMNMTPEDACEMDMFSEYCFDGLSYQLRYLLCTLYGITFLLAFIGNSIIIYIIAFNRRMRTITNILVASLAVADMLIACLCIPFAVAEIISYNWIFGTIGCKLASSLTAFAMAASILTLICIAGDRYQVICHPHQDRKIKTSCHALGYLAIVWIFATLLTVPLFIFSDIKKISGLLEHTFCRETWSQFYNKTYTICFTLILYIIPFLLLFVLYSKVVGQLWQLKETFSGGNSGGISSVPPSNVRKKKRAIKVLILIVLVFIFSWLPFHVHSFLRFMSKSKINDKSLFFNFTVKLIGFTSTFVNPILYGLMNTNLKRYIMVGINCRKIKKQSAPSTKEELMMLPPEI